MQVEGKDVFAWESHGPTENNRLNDETCAALFQESGLLASLGLHRCGKEAKEL